MSRDRTRILVRTRTRRCGASVLALFLLVTSQVESAWAAPGQELFETNCSVCHGITGTPVLPNAPHFSKGDRLEKSDDQLHKSVADGLNVMPPWNSVLSEQEIDLILAYIRTLAK